jgi:hypothetical protein
MDRMNLQRISLLWGMSAALEKVAKNNDAPADRMNSDSRISARYVFEARILIRFCRGSETFAAQGWACDLSESGLGAFVGENLVVGELVTLQIPLGVSGKELIAAKVCRQLGTHYGFQFIALSSEQRLGIQAVQKGQKEIPNWHATS